MNPRELQSLELSRALTYLAGFTVSEAGREACLALRPFDSLERIRREAALFEQGRLWAERTPLRPEPFDSLDGVLRYLETPASVLDADALWVLGRTLAQAGELRLGMLEADGSDLRPLWMERCRDLLLPAKSMSALRRCLADDGRLRDESSPDLARVRAELRRLHQQCTRKVKEFAAEYNILHYLQDDFITLSSDRYVLPLKTNFKGPRR